MDRIIVGLERYEDYLRKLSQKTAYPYYIFKERTFPNDEVLLRLEDPESIRGKQVILFFPTYPDPNVNLIKLFLGLSILKDYGCRGVTLIVPYLSYSRQDKRFLTGEAISLKVLLNILSIWPITKLITVNVHNYNSLREYARQDIIDLNLILELTKSALNIIGLENTVLIAPDVGRREDVERVADSLNMPFAYCIKSRDRVTGEVTIKEVVGIKGHFKKALIIDDEVSTGGTAIKVTKKLRSLGIEDVYLAAVHLLLVDAADVKLFNSGVKRIFGTNTIRNNYSIIDITEYLANILK